MMKKFINKVLQMCILGVLVSICNIAFCSEKLTDNVADIFRSENFIITYQVKENNKLPGQSFVIKDEIVTLAKEGKKKLFSNEFVKKGQKIKNYFIDDGVFIYSYFVKNGQVFDGSSFDGETRGSSKNTIQKFPKSVYGNHTMFDMYFDLLMIDFNSILPEYNEDTGYEYEGIPVKENMCYVYNGSGRDIIDGTTYVYEEFVMPSNYALKATSRFYFSNNNLAKYIRIDDMKTFENDVEIGGAKVIDIKLFSNTIDPQIFAIPENLKVARML